MTAVLPLSWHECGTLFGHPRRPPDPLDASLLLAACSALAGIVRQVVHVADEIRDGWKGQVRPIPENCVACLRKANKAGCPCSRRFAARPSPGTTWLAGKITGQSEHPPGHAHAPASATTVTTARRHQHAANHPGTHKATMRTRNATKRAPPDASQRPPECHTQT